MCSRRRRLLRKVMSHKKHENVGLALIGEGSSSSSVKSFFGPDFVGEGLKSSSSSSSSVKSFSKASPSSTGSFSRSSSSMMTLQGTSKFMKSSSSSSSSRSSSPGSNWPRGSSITSSRQPWSIPPRSFPSKPTVRELRKSSRSCKNRKCSLPLLLLTARETSMQKLSENAAKV